MPSCPTLRIFLSYGHDQYASLAVRLKHDLEAVGHEVWFDVAHLKIGGDWEHYIEDGLDFASAVPDCGRFLLLMTPHSVRRPNGYCLNELARSFGRNLPVIPVMVSTVEPPLSIGRLQYFDMRECFPAEQHEEQYQKQFQQLLNGIAEKQVPFDGVRQRLLNYLAPISYSDDLSRHLARFTGREWVMAEVEKWLASSRRVLWITGDAGVGKSALAAWLCDKRPEIAAYHFCRFGNSDRVDARKALFSLAYQLSTQFPEYRDRLNASPLDKTVLETNVPAIFGRLFVDLLNDLSPTITPQVILIDALDEVSHNGNNELASLIGSGFDRLPSWLRLIATSRPQEQEINFDLQALDPWMLDAGRRENRKDIRKYLLRELRPFTGNGAPSEQVISTIADKSEGLFLYVNWVRQELQDGRLSLQQVESFPRGLGGVYKEFFQRYFLDLSKYNSECRPALEAICAAREPLERDDFLAMFGWLEYQMDALAGQFGSLFPVRDGLVRPFHQSVRDWLTDRQRSGPYRVDPRAGEQRLADFTWQQYKRGVGAMRRYCIRHAPSHLAACQRKTELIELLLDPNWMAAKLNAEGVVSLLGDFDSALNLLSAEAHQKSDRRVTDEPETEVLQLVQGALRLSSNVIANDPAQFASQMVGRLLGFNKNPAVVAFITRVVEGRHKPWLQPLHPSLHPPGTALVRMLVGHRREIQGVALSSDGRVAVSASKDRTLKVWDVETGNELRTLVGHTDWVHKVAMSKDGIIAVSASRDQTLKVWDVASGKVLHNLIGHKGWVNGVTLSPDGETAISASEDHTLKVWDVSSGIKRRTLRGHAWGVYGIAFSPDARVAISCSWHEAMKVWDVQSGHELHTLDGHTSGVNGVALSADGDIAVSASWDQTLKVWDVEQGCELRTLIGHTGVVTDVVLNENAAIAVSASEDQTLKLWDVVSGHEIGTLSGHTGAVNAVALSEDGKVALSGSDDYSLGVWTVGDVRQALTVVGHSGLVSGIALSDDGSFAVSASEDCTLKIWDVSSGHELRTLVGHGLPVTAVALSEKGIVVSSSADGTLKVWDVKSGHELRNFDGHTRAVYDVALRRDSEVAVSASKDWTVKVWDVNSGREIRTLEGHTQAVHGVALSWDGAIAVSGSWDKTLKVWDVDSGHELCSLTGHTEGIHKVALSRDGRFAASASWDKTVKVWDVTKCCELRTLIGHTDRVNDVALSEDDKFVVSASWDGTIRVWVVETGDVFATFTCDGSAHSCAFCDPQKLIVAGDAAGHINYLRVREPNEKNRPE